MNIEMMEITEILEEIQIRKDVAHPTKRIGSGNSLLSYGDLG